MHGLHCNPAACTQEFWEEHDSGVDEPCLHLAIFIRGGTFYLHGLEFLHTCNSQTFDIQLHYSHVQGMPEIKTDIGHARAWIR